MQTVSVILTSYNAAGTIRRTLESIFAQEGAGKLFDLDVIAVDDCSTDETVSILQQYPVRIFSTRQNSGGPNQGRNIGLTHAMGEYICFADHDDQWVNNRVLLQLKAAPFGLVITGWHKTMDEKLGRVYEARETSPAIKVYQPNEVFLMKLARRRNTQKAHFGTIMIHHSLKHIRFEEQFGMVDYDWILNVFRNNPSVEVRKCIMIRHTHFNNLSMNYEFRKYNYYKSMMAMEAYEYDYPELVAEGIRRLNGAHGRFHYLIGEMQKARRYFRRSVLNPVTLMYYMTSYAGAGIVKKNFRVSNGS
ncbi:MAG: glycosyltransferase family 2 protein [Flavobacteriales bacterium]|nr:glycosyltransferase family 2 protein [Flavobacteriales bacterium]MCB9449255.1 glycosyltransferase family 2 protein [Flavobacteriales bacterium]